MPRRGGRRRGAARQIGGIRLANSLANDNRFANITNGNNNNISSGGHTSQSSGGSNGNKSNIKGVIVMSTNVGSLGSAPLDTGNINVRSHVARRLAYINNKYGRIDSLHLQETNNYDVEFLPFFKKPAATNANVTYGRGLGGVRGVSSYTLDGNGAFDTDDTKNEIACVIRSYRNNRNQITKFAQLNIYRNQSVDFSRSSDETHEAIRRILIKLRDIGVYQSLIIGDFNDTSFKIRLNGFRELTHGKLYHKKNGSTAKRKIDKVFTNIANVGFLEILNSCENVHKRLQDFGKFEEVDFGHKTICLWVGAPPQKTPTSVNTFASLKSLKLIAKNDMSTFPAIDPDKSPENKPYTEYLANLLTNKCEKLIHSALVTRTTNKHNNQVILMNSLEQCVEANVKKKVKSQWKSTYSYMAKIKEGIGDGHDNVRPSLEKNVDKLNNKLSSLNVMNDSVAVKATEDLFPINDEHRGPRLTNNKQIRNIILAVSNSGATDYLGMSLKHTKIILSRNVACRQLFSVIEKRCIDGGYFPEIWRQDQITLLYKNKGDRTLPQNYRPITISPSLGKHLEKCITFFLSNMNDRNPENHAYRPKSSCMTAIVDVQKKLLKVRNPMIRRRAQQVVEESENDRDLNLGSKSWRFITGFSTDDISSAFESVEHRLVCLAIERTYHGDDAKISNLIGSYLKRVAYAIERSDTSDLGMKNTAAAQSSGGLPPYSPNDRSDSQFSGGLPPNTICSGGISSNNKNCYNGEQPVSNAHEFIDPGTLIEAVTTKKVMKKQVRRVYHQKTAPQGSLLSPFLWRVYDAIFTSIYKKSLQVMVSRKICDAFCIDHVSYADDHLTIYTIKVGYRVSDQEIADKIKTLTLLCRNQLSDATKVVGCGVNPTKSENVIPVDWHGPLKVLDPSFETKSSFKWLGYYLNLTEKGELVFDIDTMITKLKTLERLRDSIFQYTESVTLKLKIYKTYFAPFVEFYLPIVIQSKVGSTTDVHKFQHNCICRSTGAGHTISRKALEEKVGEPSVMYKVIRLALRIRFCCGTDDAERKARQDELIIRAAQPTARVLRSGTVNYNAEVTDPILAKKNFIFKINAYASIELPSDNKAEKFHAFKLKKWVSKENKKINAIIARRAAERNAMT